MPESRHRVAYYAHHHGSGHLRHALRIAQLNAVDLLVTGTAVRRAEALPSTQFVDLPPDVQPDGRPYAPSGNFLHYAPTVPAIRERFDGLQRAWTRFRPDVVVVDVSVEVAVFARLCGYPVIHRRMPGRRTDPAHEAAYTAAAQLVAYYPRAVEDPQHLAAFGERTVYLGMLEPSVPDVASGLGVSSGSGARTVAVQTSLGGHGTGIADIVHAARCTPDWLWTVLGVTSGSAGPVPANLRLLGVVDNPVHHLRGADVVISAAGHNAVAAAAAANRPTLLIPEPRPFDEQAAFARMLQDVAAIPTADSWDAVTDWARTLTAVQSSDPQTLRRTLFVDPDSYRRDFVAMIGRAALSGQYQPQ